VERSRGGMATDRGLATPGMTVSAESPLIHQKLAERFIHQLRNPLGVITTGASLLADSLDNGLTDEDRSILQSIEDASERMRIILNQLQFIASPELPSVEPVAVEEMCRSAVANVKRTIREDRKVVFALNSSSDIPKCRCNFDQGQIALEYMILALIQSRESGRIYYLKIRADADFVYVALSDRIGDQPAVAEWTARRSAPSFEDNSMLLAVARRMLQVNGGWLSTGVQEVEALATAAFPRHVYQEDY
jgi:light-regulated signal transduction histidine kinase (bacteriophytochrome)